MRDKVKGFTALSLTSAGPHRQHVPRLQRARSGRPVAACQLIYRTSANLGTDHSRLISLYRRPVAARVKKVQIGSGLRYDLAVRSPEYVEELVTHRRRLPQDRPGTHRRRAARQDDETRHQRLRPLQGDVRAISGRRARSSYLIPYFIAAHPGTHDEDMLNLALGSNATTSASTRCRPSCQRHGARHGDVPHRAQSWEKLGRDGGAGNRPDRPAKSRCTRLSPLARPENWPLAADALKAMGRADLIGNGKARWFPPWQPAGTGANGSLPDPPSQLHLPAACRPRPAGPKGR